ncbi:heparinase II/III domain-containing protein [Pseudalkalibacillus berkeleyi]|uniref:Heparinase II/III family protein n=1 Tax=Pseudalkalibacillus berkeleyi TaxID=1069813 RepID=A0ABS9H4F2_9BACL|nr:heparinase II/III family protein [Pseudalkalibacillus berkeleyi]MCF6138824.1 heparinase II/III family protein [Pseudalkalibacillus berkeleyi]
MIKSLITEYGLPWLFNRSLYSAKLKMMRAIPNSDKLFEKEVNVKRVDILDLNVRAIDEFLDKVSNEKKKGIVTIADNALVGKVMGFSSMELDYGNPINWHINPITKVEVSKKLKWYQIPDFDPLRGDIKVIWEASRFTHFFYFARAFMLTKDTKYYEGFSQQLNNWLQNNRYPFGSHFKCGQEATLRMINALIAFEIFKSNKLTTKKDELNIKKLIEGSYKKVLSNFFYAHKCIKNNHTLSEIVGLIIGAWSCNDQKRLKKAYELLDKEIQIQFLPDGGYIQYSFNYQRFALQIIELVMKISEKTKLTISDRSKSLIKKSVTLMYQMQDNSGDVPNYGSNDGALIFPVTTCGYRDFRAVINTIFSLIDGKRVYKPGDYDEELLWFGDKKLDEIPISIIEKKSSAFNESGFYSLRTDTGNIMTVLQNFKTRPAQMDQFHIDLWHKGINIFCDSGTYSYATDIGKEMALTAAHNTVKVDGKDQMKKRGPFLIYEWTKPRNIIVNDNLFKGRMVSKNGYEHLRHIEKNEQGFMILDEVIGKGEYCKFLFHTPCEVKIIEGGFELYDKGKLNCTVTISEYVGVEIELKKSYRSLFYLKIEEINCVIISSPLNEKKCNMQFNISLKN